jgi:hypothetical protein
MSSVIVHLDRIINIKINIISSDEADDNLNKLQRLVMVKFVGSSFEIEHVILSSQRCRKLD